MDGPALRLGRRPPPARTGSASTGSPGAMAKKVSSLQEEAAGERVRHASEVHELASQVHELVQKNTRLFKKAQECTRSSSDSAHAARELRVELQRLQTKHARVEQKLDEANEINALLKDQLEAQVRHDFGGEPFIEEEAPEPARLPGPAPTRTTRSPATPDLAPPKKPKQTFRRDRSTRKSMALPPLSPLSEHR